MSVATKRPAQTSSLRIPVLIPLYGADLESFCARADGTYRCGSGAASEFSLAFSGGEATHCSFIRKAGTFSVNRIDGRVWVNDLPVSGLNRLTEGDVISLGPVSYRLEFQDEPPHLPEPDDRPLMSFKSAETVVERPSTDLARESLPIPAGIAAPSVQDTSIQTALQKEREEHQRLLTLRQQQLGELTQVLRERERDADSRLMAIEERSSQLTAQWNELARQQERLAAQEREHVLRSLESDRQRQALTDQQRQLANAAEQNSQTLAAVEQAQLEHSRQEAELRPLREQNQTAQAELLHRESLQQARESGFQQLCDEYATREASLSQQERLAAQEREHALRSLESDRQRQALTDQQRQLSDAAEQNSRTQAAVEQAQLEHSRQEAELRRLREQIQAAQAEQLHRESQQQARESGFQQLCDEYATREASLSQHAFVLLSKAEALALQEVALSDRAKALADAEQTSAATASVNADTRSMEQLAAIAAQQEAAVRERQQAQQAQQAQIELRQLQQSIEIRQLALQEWQSELDSRANEVSARLLTLKSFRRQQRAAQTVVAEQAASQVAVDAENLRAAAIEAKREELDRREAAIVAAEVRFAETRRSADAVVQAAESERTALLSANKDLLCERNALSQLRQDLTSRESGIAEREVLVARQLEDMRSRFAVLDLRAAELKHHESEIDSRAADVHRRVQQFKSDQHAHRETNRTAPPVDESNSAFVESAAELLAVRQQLDDLQQALAATDGERASMLAEREALLSAVRELQKALQDARQDVEDANRLRSESGFQEQRLQQAYQSIEEHCQSLQLSESKLLQANDELDALRARLVESGRKREELNAKLAEYSLSANSVSPVLQAGADSAFIDSCETRSRELDVRAELLDRRDEDLRERTRKIEHTEGDIESQRRLLLEARQQLELARAEIQVAMRNHTEPAQQAGSPLPEFGLSFSGEPKSDRQLTHQADLPSDSAHGESDDPSYVPTTDLRSELAGLFGLRKPAAESVTPPPLPPAAFVDVSEPSGENQSVMFHFGSDAAQLAATESILAAVGDAEPAREENSDDVVRDYMEQLLSRNRKSAGHALPGELKAVEKKKEPEAVTSTAKGAGGPAPKSPPKVKSYIEQYMAGNMGNLDDSEPLTMSEPDIDVKDVAIFNEVRPVQPRQKMDLLKLKENMDSFRTLSTQSVENALASHAIKVERLGFSGRSGFTALLMISTVLLGIANAYGAIDAPLLTWVTLTSSIAMLTELYRQYLAIAVHTRNPLDWLFASEKAKGPVPQSSKRNGSASAVPGSASDDLSSNDDCVKPSDAPEYLESLPAGTSAS